MPALAWSLVYTLGQPAAVRGVGCFRIGIAVCRLICQCVCRHWGDVCALPTPWQRAPPCYRTEICSISLIARAATANGLDMLTHTRVSCRDCHGLHACNAFTSGVRLPVARGLARRLPRSAADDSQFTAEQLAFLERKRLFKAGLGPAMPENTVCPDCKGHGTVICWECKGTGVNERDCKDIMGSEVSEVRQQNGVINVMWFLFKGGPCFICRGKPDVPCVSCEGTGIRGFDLANYSGD